MFYWWIDVCGRRQGVTPLLVFGTNAIFAYVVASVAGDTLATIPVGDVSLKQWLYAQLFLPWLSPRAASLGMGLCFVAFCWAVNRILYAKRIFLRV
jgi:predicted acyltransferase